MKIYFFDFIVFYLQIFWPRTTIIRNIPEKTWLRGKFVMWHSLPSAESYVFFVTDRILVFKHCSIFSGPSLTWCLLLLFTALRQKLRGRAHWHDRAAIHDRGAPAKSGHPHGPPAAHPAGISALLQTRKLRHLYCVTRCHVILISVQTPALSCHHLLWPSWHFLLAGHKPAIDAVDVVGAWITVTGPGFLHIEQIAGR